MKKDRYQPPEIKVNLPPAVKEHPKWLLPPGGIEAAVARQRAERLRYAQRVDDGPLTILVPGGYGPTPGFDKPIPRWRRICNFILNKFRK